MGSADAATREAAWLATAGDGLPALLAQFGGPLDVVQPYWPRTPNTEQRGLYLMRTRMVDNRFAAVRTMNHYTFTARLWWPLLAGDGSAEEDQQALDTAVDLVLARIDGPPFDKSHGGRFLSVGEGGSATDVVFHDPAQTITSLGVLLADVTYQADDFETLG